MKILVTGARGQLGREVVLGLNNSGNQVVGVGRDELDLSQPAGVANQIADFGADWVINCAAYTQVDQAEEESELAFAVNRDGARAIAAGVARYGGRLLHISTDYIFDGEQSRPYLEDDEANPRGVYGQSKWEGEQSIREVLPEAIVLRTAWVYGVHGHNFVRTILQLAAKRQVLRVVDDQIGTPSWTADIVMAMRVLMEADQSGTFHYTNEGVASWYDFALQTIEYARELGYPIKTSELEPIPCSEYPTPAARPHYSVLNKGKVRPLLVGSNPHWRASLLKMLEQLREVRS